MQIKEDFKFILNSKIYHVPYQSCVNINPLIINTLLTGGLYEVKSDISEDIFHSFINYLTTKEIPFLNDRDICEYEEISEEFDIMKDIINIFKYKTHYQSISSHFFKNLELQIQKNQQQKALKQKVVNYGQIIDHLFNNDGISSEFKFNETRHKLWKACLKENIKLVDLLTRKKIEYNGFLYVLDEKEGTAGVFRNQTDRSEVMIPRSIQHESKEFIVKIIYEDSFRNSNNIHSIEFSEDSELCVIEEYAFMYSSLKKITIPRSVIKLSEGWCGHLSKLEIEMKENNQHYSKFEEKFILGKKDEKSDKFDVLVYSLEDEETIKIPSFIKRIAPFAFSRSKSLHNIEFEEDSELESIGEFAFANSSLKHICIPKKVARIDKSAFSECNIKHIEFEEESKLREISQELFFDSHLVSITIPKRVKRISDSAFFFCGHLNSVIFNEESELCEIDKSSFYGSKIESICVPSCVELKNGWNNNMSKMKEIIIFDKKRENMKIYKEFVLGKSDCGSDEFDIFLFALPHIRKVTIPSFVKYIASYAFTNCKNLEKVEFESDSQLKEIRGRLFEESLIERIEIPPHVTKIAENSFSFTNKLKVIEFSEQSEIKTICDFAFSHSSVEFLSIPSSIVHLNNCLLKTPKLNTIKIIECEEENVRSFDGQLIIGKTDIKRDIFDVLLFGPRNIKEVFIPSFIKKIGSNAFNECSQLFSVTFSEDSQLESIENDAFSDSSIESIIIPKGVVNIGECAFMNCSNLKNVYFSKHSKLRVFRKSSFLFSSIEYICIPSHVMKIEKHAFSGCRNLKKIEFEKNCKLRIIEKRAFSDSSIESISIPRHVLRIERGVFEGSDLKKVFFEKDSEIQIIGEQSFSSSSIESINIPSSVIYIGKKAFNECVNLRLVEIEESTKLDTSVIENIQKIFSNCLVMFPATIIHLINNKKK
ncbi:hypothetical protein M9Y10_024614 [Tritrichomonas musculus]|uniref:Surface antigen BspA-like protein n=1 Tax=Tritrichomonas musculus TaxID=1915356 RepID=A0ABR2HAT6_9EUKA